MLTEATVKVPALGRLDQTMLRTRIFDSLKEARTQIKQGNVYVRITPPNEMAGYWVRFEDPEGLVVFSSPTRVRFINTEGECVETDIEPHSGVEHGAG